MVSQPIGHPVQRLLQGLDVTMVDNTKGRYLYQAYQAQADIMAALRDVAGIALQGFGHLAQCSPSLAATVPVRHATAGSELLGRLRLSH